ncbi:MAG: hypothetical protein IJN61_03825 [Clostridia bacterium]|nr:hypothetical protein [Clostridia bacterium]
MAKHTVKAKARYQLRGDTAAALEEVNPTLKPKEPVLVLDESGTAVAFKIGDGVTPYAELPLHGFGDDFNERINANAERLDGIEQRIGDVDAAMDGILAIQNALIGGAAE